MPRIKMLSFASSYGRIVAAAFLLFCASGMTQAPAAVNVQFIHPDQYSDSAFRLDVTGARSLKNVMSEISKTLQQLGARYLPPGQTLNVDILNIQMAGYTDWWSVPGQNIRIIDNASPSPSFKLRYMLKAKGKVLAAATETVSDIAYRTHPGALFSSDPLIYEKILLEQWFRKKFEQPEPAL